MIDGAEVFILNKTEEEKLKITERKILRLVKKEKMNAVTSETKR